MCWALSLALNLTLTAIQVLGATVYAYIIAMATQLIMHMRRYDSATQASPNSNYAHATAQISSSTQGLIDAATPLLTQP